MTQPCAGLLGRLVGHKFVPAYDHTPPSGDSLPEPKPDDFGSRESYSAIAQALTAKTLIALYCVRCGLENIQETSQVDTPMPTVNLGDFE